MLGHAIRSEKLVHPFYVQTQKDNEPLKICVKMLIKQGAWSGDG